MEDSDVQFVDFVQYSTLLLHAAAVCSADVEIISQSARTGSSSPDSSASPLYLCSLKLAFA